MTDDKASSSPQLPPPTVKTRVRLNGSEERACRTHVTRSIVYCSLFSVCRFGQYEHLIR